MKIATKFAVMLQNITHDFNKSFAVQVVLRIGIDTGPVGAGIVGNFRPRYDCFGKAMTGAIKTMESCVKGKITITKEVAEKIKEHFILLPESSGSFVVLNEK